MQARLAFVKDRAAQAKHQVALAAKRAADAAAAKAAAAAKDLQQQVKAEVAKMRRKSIVGGPANRSQSSNRGAAQEAEPAQPAAKEHADVEVKGPSRAPKSKAKPPLVAPARAGAPPAAATRHLRFEEAPARPARFLKKSKKEQSSTAPSLCIERLHRTDSMVGAEGGGCACQRLPLL